MTNKIQVAFDCADPSLLANFWAEALGYQLQPPPEGFASWDEFADAHDIPQEKRGDIAAIIDPDGGPRIIFLRVPESKSVKNRVHLDVNVSDHDKPVAERKVVVDQEVKRLVGIGARMIKPSPGARDYWVVMQDPEGNEFCVQ